MDSRAGAGLRRSNWPPNCIVPLQVAQVQISRGFWNGLEGFKSKDGPDFGLPKRLACRRPPAAGPLAAIAATGSAIILIFLN